MTQTVKYQEESWRRWVQETGTQIPDEHPAAIELRSAVQAGVVEAIQRTLRNDPALARAPAWQQGQRHARHTADTTSGTSNRQENVISSLGLGARSAGTD